MRIPAFARSALTGAQLTSSTLAIGAAGTFVLATAALSVAMDRHVAVASASPEVWRLRGTLAPVALPLRAAPRRAEI